MGKAQATAKLDATIMVVGRGVLVDALTQRLSSLGIELVHASRDDMAQLARVSAPDLILIAGDGATDRGGHLLELFATGDFALGQPVLVLGGASMRALGGTALRSNMALLVPEGGLELCARRVRELIEQLAGRGLAGKKLQDVVDEIVRGPAKSGETARVAVMPAPVAAGVAATPKRVHRATFVGLPPAVAEAAAPRVIEVPASAVRVTGAISPFARTMLAGIAEPPPAVGLAPATRAVAAEPVAAPAPRPNEPSLQPEPIDVRIESLAPEPSVEPGSRMIEGTGEALSSTPLPPPMNPIGRAAIVWTAFLRQALARPKLLAACALLLVSAVGTYAFATRGAKSEPSLVTASLATAAAPQPIPVAAHPENTQNAKRASSYTSVQVRKPSRSAPELATNDDALEHGDAQKGLRPEVARKLERANHLVDEGHGLLKRGHLGLAEASYMKALTAWPDFPRALAGLTRVHLQRKDGAEAVRWAKRLVAKDPKSGQNQLLLGDACALRGDLNGARAAWQQAVRYANPTARKRLKERGWS